MLKIKNYCYFKKYNNINSIIVLASYPRQKETYSKNISADASFTKNVVLEFTKLFPQYKIIVLTITEKNEEIYKENEILVIRTLRRNNPLSYLRAISYAKQFNNVKNVLIEFEFSSFGDSIATGFLPILLLFLRLMGKKINFNLHQVATDLSTLSNHIGIKRKNYLLKVFNIVINLYYRVIGLLSNSVIVTEDYLKIKLNGLIPKNKVRVITHGVNINLRKRISKIQAKHRLGIHGDSFVILCFGYISWYKGTDFIINALKNTNKINNRDIKLIIAGGPSFTQSNKEHYRKFLNKTVSITKKTKHIIITGFVNEKDIASYFSAADLVLFPYRTFMSSSGSISLASSFYKPFLISNRLKPMFYSQDIKKTLKQSGLKSKDLIFNLTRTSLLKTIETSMNSSNLHQIEKFSRSLCAARDYKKIASLYKDIISPEKGNLNASFYNIFKQNIFLRFSRFGSLKI